MPQLISVFCVLYAFTRNYDLLPISIQSDSKTVCQCHAVQTGERQTAFFGIQRHCETKLRFQGLAQSRTKTEIA